MHKFPDPNPDAREDIQVRERVIIASRAVIMVSLRDMRGRWVSYWMDLDDIPSDVSVEASSINEFIASRGRKISGEAARFEFFPHITGKYYD